MNITKQLELVCWLINSNSPTSILFDNSPRSLKKKKRKKKKKNIFNNLTCNVLCKIHTHHKNPICSNVHRAQPNVLKMGNFIYEKYLITSL